MNEKTVFVRTDAGEDEASNRTARLSKDIKRALLMVDGTASVAEIMKRSSPSLRGMLEDMFRELARGGFIQDKAMAAQSAKLVKPAPAASKKTDAEGDGLDFTAAFRVPTQSMLAAEAAKLAEKARADASAEAARRLAHEEKMRLKAEQQAAERVKLEAARAQAEREARETAEEKQREAEEAARAAAAEKARLEAELARAKEEAQAAKLQARAEEQARQEAARALAEREAREAEKQRLAEDAARAAEKARLEAELARAKEEAQAAKLQARAEEQARQEAARALAEREGREAEKQRLAENAARAVEKARLEAELARAKEEAQAAKLQARADEQARQEAARALAERETRELAERLRLERAAADAREVAERHARESAETIHRAEQQAAQVKADIEEKTRTAAEVARLKVYAEQEVARAQEVTERHARESAEAARRAEQQAARIKTEADAGARVAAEERERLEAELAKLRAEVDVRAQADVQLAAAQAEQGAGRADAVAREEAERVAKQTEIIRDLAEQTRINDEAVQREQERATEQTNAQMLAAVVRLNAEHAAIEDSVFSALEESTKAVAERQWVSRALEGNTGTERRKERPAVPGCDSRGGNNGVPVVERRTTTAAVLFFDIVGYTKQPDSRQLELKQQFSQLVTSSLAELDAGERIILDTGDGAAIGFLQHPTDALESAMHFRAALVANKHFDYPDLRVRIGIHLGPVSLVKDMNGQVNMLGDGINSAQRVMSFAGHDQIYVSRAYFEFVSNLSDEYKDLFRYRGGKEDKHGREHQVYELLDADADSPVQAESIQPAGSSDAFNFDAFDAALTQSVKLDVAMPPSAVKQSAADMLLMDAINIGVEPVIEIASAVEQAPVSPEVAISPEEVMPPEVAISPEVAIKSEALRAADERASQHAADEARQLADAQARKWAEAELRAAALAEHNKVPQQVFQPESVNVARVPRKAVPWGKLSVGLLVLIVAAVFAVPFVLPTQGYVAGIEQQLSAKLQQPVHVGHLAGRLLPTPRLILSDVSVGKTKQIQIRQVQVNFAFASLLEPVKYIGGLDLDGVKVQGDALFQVAAWLQQTAADSQYPVRHVALTQGRLEADGIQLSDVEGGLEFDSSGKFSQGRLSADGHKLALEVSPAAESRLKVSLMLRDSALPSLPNWVFEDLKAVGELGRDELRITELDGRIRGGALTGDARINWRTGWRVQGALVASVIPLQNINKLLSGDLNGSARFQMQAPSLSRLADAAVLNGAFSVSKGLINGVDIVETARLRSRENLPGGRTHFDELSGELSYANGRYRFNPFKVRDSVVKAAGALTVDGDNLSGTMSADLTMRTGQVALQVGGTTESPTLHVAR